MKNYFDKPLFIFEMANNHMGSAEHGLRMIEDFTAVAARFPFRFAFKFQFRHFETFIHPEYKTRMDLKYVKRFSETALSADDFRKLKAAVVSRGFLPICTPFDEPSVDLIEELDFAVIKIASCSFTDWPLLERIVKTDKPIIASTAGSPLDDIDKVVSFLKHRDKCFALMHCVGEYPTKSAHLQLNQIDLLRQRYPDVPIGYSTHEEPGSTIPVQLAVAKGALLFEKHVAVVTPAFPKNDYSATPEEAALWLEAAEEAFSMCGVSGERTAASEKELADLRQFRRGVFASRPVAEGERISSESIFFAFPNGPGQLVANDMSKYSEYFAKRPIEPLSPIAGDDVSSVDRREKIYGIVQGVRRMLREGNVVVPGMATLEISHHYGLDRFEEVGCTIINVINREYCKKLIVVFPGQKHPEQYHKVKEETFVVLAGDVKLTLDGVPKHCLKGDVVTITRGTKHPFTSDNGAVIEEISSTHYKDDSYYTDPAILRNKDRKTVLSHWMA